jgi:uncharacterized membrane protein
MLFVLALRRLRSSPLWPFRSFQALYSVVVPIAPVAVMLLWTLWACTRDGEPRPLPYVPLLNPLELAQAFLILVAYDWARRAVTVSGDPLLSSVVTPVFAGLVFLTLNALVGRVVHFYLDVPFDFDDLLQSAVFEAGISILWGAVAGVLMTFARRRLDRPVWMVGAALLGVLIVKLFTVDLSNIGAVARIVSFLATGLVILLIGYFAPAPPRDAVQEQAT